MEVATPDDPWLFLRCSYEVESKILSLTRAFCEESGRSTECQGFSLLFLGFSFPLRPPPKPLFPLMLLWSWLTFDVGMLCLSSLSTAYGNIMFVFLTASDDCALTIKILSSDVGSRCSSRFRRFCSYVGEGDPSPTLELFKKLFNDQRLVALASESNVPVLFL
ncbi:hypothetical protein V6N13_049675 [Hibiscus sabdariffa]